MPLASQRHQRIRPDVNQSTSHVFILHKGFNSGNSRGFGLNLGQYSLFSIDVVFRERWGDYDAPLRSHRGRISPSRVVGEYIHQPNSRFHFPQGFYKLIIREVSV